MRCMRAIFSASRWSVLIRSPGRVGIREGAITSQGIPFRRGTCAVRSRTGQPRRRTVRSQTPPAARPVAPSPWGCWATPIGLTVPDSRRQRDDVFLVDVHSDPGDRIVMTGPSCIVALVRFAPD